MSRGIERDGGRVTSGSKEHSELWCKVENSGRGKRRQLVRFCSKLRESQRRLDVQTMDTHMYWMKAFPSLRLLKDAGESSLLDEGKHYYEIRVV